MRGLCLIVVLVTFLMAPGTTELFAQKVPIGTWTGLVTPPGGVPYESNYLVRERGDSLVIRMDVSAWGAGFPFHNVAVTGEALRFGVGAARTR